MALGAGASAHAAEPSAATAAFPLVPEEPASAPAVARFAAEPTAAHTASRPASIPAASPSAPITSSWTVSRTAPAYVAAVAPSSSTAVEPLDEHPVVAAPPGVAERPAAVERTQAGEPRTGPEADSESARKRSEAWMAAIEGVTHAPVDVGVQAGIQTPFGLRVFGGYGWVPLQYLSFVTSVATVASNTDAGSGALLKNGFQQGRTWRAQLGIKPFRGSGVYLDGGYSEVSLEGGIDASTLGLPTTDAIHVECKVRMWLVELGYQTDIAGRVVLGIAAGMMGTLDAQTRVETVDMPIGQDPITQAAAQVDEQLESRGYVPTLTLRLGFDFI